MSRKIFLHLLLIVYSIVFIIPLVWVFTSSLKSNQDIFAKPFSLPTHLDFSVFIRSWQEGDLGRYVINSLVVTSISASLVLLVSSMAAFAFSRFEFKGKSKILTLFIFGLLVPIQAFFIPQNQLLDQFNLKDHWFTLVIPYTGLGISLATWLFIGYLDSLPKELFESGRIDGANDWKLYSSIAVPLLKPGIATIAIFTILGSWNEFLLAMLYIQNETYKTIPVGLLSYSSRHATDYQLLFAALTIITIPMVLIYLVFNRQVVSGLTEGSLK